jgi:2-amino-4-hydroxy-6-hydroxymethyldihydropteridine diphosphokinase/dihydropteroate synthase
MSSDHFVILGLGSSDRNAAEWIRKAVRYLKNEPGIELISLSRIYKSNAMLPAGAPASWDVPYLNAAVQLRSNFTGPESFLRQIQALEIKLGRKKRERWAPREIDLDILAIKELKIQTDDLEVPHAGLLSRPFALLPLIEVCPWAPEIWKTTARNWLNRSRKEIPFGTEVTLLSYTELVGILNITPDSFSDGGFFLKPKALAAQVELFLEQGIHHIDLGAESTRPESRPVRDILEVERLEMALGILKPYLKELRISLDSRNPEVVRSILDRYSIEKINDVQGFKNPEMMEIAKQFKGEFIAMHSLSVPPTKENVLPIEKDPLSELLAWGHERIEAFKTIGVEPARVLLDPGIGFSKTKYQNIQILERARELHALKVPLFFGHSRKSYLNRLTSKPFSERDMETSFLSFSLASKGIEYLRVHHAETNKNAINAAAFAFGPVYFSNAVS